MDGYGILWMDMGYLSSGDVKIAIEHGPFSLYGGFAM